MQISCNRHQIFPLPKKSQDRYFMVIILADELQPDTQTINWALDRWRKNQSMWSFLALSINSGNFHRIKHSVLNSARMLYFTWVFEPARAYPDSYTLSSRSWASFLDKALSCWSWRTMHDHSHIKKFRNASQYCYSLPVSRNRDGSSSF